MAETTRENPRIRDAAEQVAGAMVANEPIDPVGWCVARDADGKALYLVAIVMGSENVEQMARSLAQIRPAMKRVDTFDDSAGEPSNG